MVDQFDPRSPTRKELARVFGNDQRIVRAFEKVFDLIPSDFIVIEERLEILENPPVLFVSTDVEITTDAYAIIVEADALILTLPKCSEDIEGRIWTFTLDIVGSVTIDTQGVDSFTTPDNPAETSLILNRRGTTIGLRCISNTKWSFV